MRGSPYVCDPPCPSLQLRSSSRSTPVHPGAPPPSSSVDASRWLSHSCLLLSLSPVKAQPPAASQRPLACVLGDSLQQPRPLSHPAVRLGALPAAHPAHSSPEGLSLSPSARRGRSTDSREVNPAFPGGNALGRVCRAPGPHLPPQGPLPSSQWAIQLASALPGEHVYPAHGPASTTLKRHGLLRGPPCPLPSRTVGSSSWC